MKIKLSQLRKVIREELNVLESQQDDESYKKIMDMIQSVLGDSPEVKKLGGELHNAMASKKSDPGTISMKSIAQQGQQKTSSEPGQTISMQSIK